MWSRRYCNQLVIVFVILLQLFDKIQSLKTHCKKDAKDCPLRNLESALVGYDLPTGKVNQTY